MKNWTNQNVYYLIIEFNKPDEPYKDLKPHPTHTLLKPWKYNKILVLIEYKRDRQAYFDYSFKSLY